MLRYNCPVCDFRYGGIVYVCEYCGFADSLGINRAFINDKAAEHRFKVDAELYRVKRQFEGLAAAHGEQSQRLAAVLGRLEVLEAAFENMQKPSALSALPSPPKVGEIIAFGGFQWRVLMLVKGNRVLLISNDILEKRAYHGSVEARSGAEYGVNWEKSDLRAYLNGKFLEKFSADEKSKIALTRNETKNSKDTDDYVFLLGLEEARLMFKTSGDRIAKFNETASWWWLRTPGRDEYRATNVYGDGHVYVRGSNVNSRDGGVRPVLWLNL